MAEDIQTAETGENGKRSGLFGLLRSLIGRGGDSHLRDAFEELIEESEERETPIASDERALIANILKFGEMTAYDVMVPRADIIGFEVNTPLQELVQHVVTHPHSRYPVYREALDDILGMVHIKDVLAHLAKSPDEQEKSDLSLRDIMRQTLIVAPSMRVLDLLLQMRQQRRHMALVVDEFGGIDGLVTIEDLVEEIVGEIEDEHDIVAGPQIENADDGTILADARTPIETLEEKFGPILDEEERDEDIDTLGGLVFTLAGRVPTRGELIQHDASGVEFEVLDADPRRIKRLKLRNLPEPAQAQG
ncbi:hemolysin family protein [Hwanghaeella sp.]|uniref:hemolysin family protein n=1 Tax=Hwanghaeella sp. TaxID=2605943 RepID=UPI003CCC28C2